MTTTTTDFIAGDWKTKIDTRDFVFQNITEYDGDASFLEGPTKKTNEVWLDIHCKSLLDSIRGKSRYNVFYIKTKINESWICEGDLGKGFK